MSLVEYSPTQQPQPGINVVSCTEQISSCQGCGGGNYARDTGEPIDFPLLDLRISVSGYQTDVTRICLKCAREIGRKLIAAADHIDVHRALDGKE